MANSIIKASKPGKLILLGEYAVLEQAPCLVAAADKNCTVQIEPNGKDMFKIEASNTDIPDVEFTVDEKGLTFTSRLSEPDKERLRFVIAVLKSVFSRTGRTVKPALIKIDTTNFYHIGSGQKLGLGASAAITVSLLSALQSYIGQPVEGRELYRKAYPIHRRAQGKLGSGSDIAAASVEGVIQYKMPENIQQPENQIESLPWPENLEVIPVWAGKSASTQDLVQRIREYRKEDPEAYNAVMEPMIQLSEEGCRAFKTGDTEALADVIFDYVRFERKLGEASGTDIVSDAHFEIKETVEESGGVYKPSGAGSGDMGVAFCNGKENRRRIENSLRENSFDIIDLSLQTQKTASEGVEA